MKKKTAKHSIECLYTFLANSYTHKHTHTHKHQNSNNYANSYFLLFCSVGSIERAPSAKNIIMYRREWGKGDNKHSTSNNQKDVAKEKKEEFCKK